MKESRHLAYRAATSSILAVVVCTGTAAASWASPGAVPAQGATSPAISATSLPAAPPNATAYADALVRAWGAGDEYRANHYASDQVLGAMFAQARVGGKHWWRTGSEGAAGTVYVTYRNGSSSSTLTIGVDNIGLGSGAGHDAYRVSFG